MISLAVQLLDIKVGIWPSITGMPSSHIRVLSSSSPSFLLIHALRNSSDGTSSWVLPPTWETWIVFPAPGSGPRPAPTVTGNWGVNYEMITFCLPLRWKCGKCKKKKIYMHEFKNILHQNKLDFHFLTDFLKCPHRPKRIDDRDSNSCFYTNIHSNCFH